MVAVVQAHLPRLGSNPSRFVLEDAVPGPTDVVMLLAPARLTRSPTFDDGGGSVQRQFTWLQGSNSRQGKQIPSPAFNGLITATRRQNFLVPPRRHRAFPLLELT